MNLKNYFLFFAFLILVKKLIINNSFARLKFCSHYKNNIIFIFIF
ncbi:putative membrane protein [Candidatus Phytoplasma solani]